LVKKTRSANVASARRWARRFGLRDAEEIGDVPGLFGGGFQGRDEMRMLVAQRQHGDAGSEIEILVAIVGVEPGSFAAREGDVGPRIGRIKGRIHNLAPMPPDRWRRAVWRGPVCGA